MDTKSPSYDAIVIGAGFTGMYQLYMLRKMGLSVKGYDRAEDFGGNWYRNRYPGCRVDTESHVYCYAFSSDILQEWSWSEQYASQPEVLRYLNFAVDKMDIREHYQFNTLIISAKYSESKNLWFVQLGDGSTESCRFLFSAAGPLSIPQMPSYDGVDSFLGEAYHSYFWPHDEAGSSTGKNIDFTGKRVGVVGTGATGVQIITEVAKSAGELCVFQRSPNWCAPLGNGPIDTEMMDGIKENYGEIINFVKNTQSGFPHTFLDKSALEVSDEEREIILEKLYKEPGYGIWFGNFYDLFTDKEANILVSKFIEKKIRQRVNDQQIADKLIPKNHGFGTKRVPLESGYYEVFNQSNVDLIDIHEDPIVKITPNGIQTGSKNYELDIIIYATGFDAITGALDKIEIVGKNGDSLKEVWADGPSTYLGLQISGFPNFFTLVAAHNGAGFCNIPICGQMQVEWIDKMLRHMKQHSLEFVEPTAQAENDWTEEVYRLMEKTLLGQTDSWFMGVNSNVEGKNMRRALVYVGGSVRYRETCEAIERDGYKGFIMR